MRSRKRQKNSCALLILSCSERKRKDIGRITAWERYDGVAFRLVKRFECHQGLPPALDIIILSAQYGLIQPHHKIPYYNQKMTRTRAFKQATYNITFLRRQMTQPSYREIFACLGKNYILALSPIDSWLPKDTPFIIPKGRIGQKMHQLKNWLEENRL